MTGFDELAARAYWLTRTRVVHHKKEPCTVYIGRPSKWGNPYKIGRDGSREEVLEKYREYVLNNEYLMGCLDELRGQVLGCWCKPNACHGDILIEIMEEFLS